MRWTDSKTLGRLVLVGLALLVAGDVASAAPPKVNHLFPAGGQRGQSVSVKLSGEFPDWPVQVWSDHPGVAATAEAEKGKVVLQLAADAQPGVAWLRFHSASGASTLQPFIVGDLPEVDEKEPNDAPSNPQSVAGKTVVNGRLQKNGDVDSFKLSLKQGETLIAALQTHTILGSPVDSVVHICELMERKALADSSPQVEAYILQQEHDSAGLDPRLIFTAPKDGDYLLRIFGFPSEPNSSIAFSGAETFIYRLTLTTGPYVVAALPLAAQRSEPTRLNFLGWNLPSSGLQTEVPQATSDAEAGALEQAAWVSPQAATGFVRIARIDHASSLAAENVSPERPQPIAIPATVSGQLAQRGSVHAFAFDGKKGEKLRITVEASSLSFPWDPHLSITAEDGKTIVESDDAKKERDPQITFSPPADGKYQVVVRDLNRHGGLDFIYRLTVEPAADFDLTLAADSFVLPTDKPLEIPVAIERREGFAESINLRALGLPAGVTAEPVTSEGKGDSSKSVKLILKSDADRSTLTDGPIHVEGATADGQRRRLATFNLSKPLAGDHAAAWLTIGR